MDVNLCLCKLVFTFCSSLKLRLGLWTDEWPRVGLKKSIRLFQSLVKTRVTRDHPVTCGLNILFWKETTGTKVVDCIKMFIPLWVGGEILPQVEALEYVGLCSWGRMEREIDRWIGAVMRLPYIMKKELSWKAKLLIYRSIYVPILTCGHELWAKTKRIRSQIEAAEMSFLHREAGRSPQR